MPTTRSSARKSAGSTPSSSPGVSGSKRKAESSPSSAGAKVKKSPAPKKQKTLEETLPDADDDAKDATKPDTGDAEKQNGDTAAPAQIEKDSGDTEMKDAAPASETASHSKDDTKSDTVAANHSNQKSQSNGDNKQPQSASANKESSTSNEATTNVPDIKSDSTSHDADTDKPNGKNSNVDAASATPATSTNDQPAGQASATDSTGNNSKSEADSAKSPDGEAVEHSSQREKSTPSSILEKGIIYFFFRGRVGIDDPSDVNDIARSYIVLRPLPKGAKLTDGSIGDQNNLRVLALPKKVLPKGPKDRFMVFVEKSKANLADLKKEFLSSSDYDTKTAGTRHTPAATPIGEGVYALTSTGRETHLAYVLTIPKDLSEVQKDIGLEAKGSFVTSVKNPQHAGPAVAQLPNDPKFPQEILDEFRSLRWGQLQPKHLDYENCQLLVIGHKDHSFAKATETEGQETDPKEEIEKLAEEEEHRVAHLEGDDTVFEDLNIDAKDYPSVQSTW